MMKYKTIIVTGGAGFIGSNFIKYMMHKHPTYNIICVDALTYAGKMQNILDLFNNPRFDFYKINICNEDAIFSLWSNVRPDCVVNFAAESHVDKSIVNPTPFVETNYKGTQVLLSASAKYGVSRYHQISTDEVYGDLPYDTYGESFNEADILKPSNPYSATKAAADLLVQSFTRTYGLEATISRCSNNYGPFQLTEKFIPKLITNALRNMPLTLYGNGRNVRDWIFVDDHCNAINLIIHNGKPGEIYNIASNNELQNLEVAKLVCNYMHISHDRISYIMDRKGHDMKYSINSEKIQKYLKWTPKVLFNDGLKETIKWYVTNEGWWKN